MNTFNTAALAVLMVTTSALATPCAKADSPEPIATSAANSDVRRFKIGAMDAVALSDGEMQAPNDNTLMAVGRTREESAALLTSAGLPGDTLNLVTHPLLLRNGERIILIDAGAGGAMGSQFGKLPASLRAAGIEPSSVTDVLISHGHPDHAAGLVGADGTLTYPNATIRVSAQEWSAMQANSAMAVLASAIRPRVETFQPGAILAPGVKAVAIGGHTPGHTGYEIASREDRLFYFGDTLIHPVISTRRPEWRNQSDGDSAEAIASRIALLNRAADENLLLYGVHFPFPSVGRVKRKGETFVWAPEAPAR